MNKNEKKKVRIQMRQHRARKDKAIKRKSEHNMKATKNTTRIVCCPPSKYLTTHNMPFLTGEGGIWSEHLPWERRGDFACIAGWCGAVRKKNPAVTVCNVTRGIIRYALTSVYKRKPRNESHTQENSHTKQTQPRREVIMYIVSFAGERLSVCPSHLFSRPSFYHLTS